MDRKHDLETGEICYAKVSDESKIITPRLHAEFVGVIVTIEGIQRVGSETLAGLVDAVNKCRTEMGLDGKCRWQTVPNS